MLSSAFLLGVVEKNKTKQKKKKIRKRKQQQQRQQKTKKNTVIPTADQIKGIHLTLSPQEKLSIFSSQYYC